MPLCFARYLDMLQVCFFIFSLKRRIFGEPIVIPTKFTIASLASRLRILSSISRIQRPRQKPKAEKNWSESIRYLEAIWRLVEELISRDIHNCIQGRNSVFRVVSFYRTELHLLQQTCDPSRPTIQKALIVYDKSMFFEWLMANGSLFQNINQVFEKLNSKRNMYTPENELLVGCISSQVTFVYSTILDCSQRTIKLKIFSAIFS